MTCGLALQQGLEHIAGFDASTMKFRANTVELYFETEDFGGFMQLLDSYPQVERLHEPKLCCNDETETTINDSNARK